ncbi:KIF27 protein, partial [Polypterus senegalus]|nr:KIF27 protein [Polypterus senegalus]
MEETPVKVAVRIRPLLPKEILHNQHVCVRVVPNTQQIIIGKDRPFTFDFVFGQNSVQDEVYITCIKPLVSSLIEGYNVTVFAYGQTGSGKTYTLGGGHGVSMAAKEKGIIPRAIQEIFQRITENHITDYTVKVSYIEVYKEELRDLLDLDTSSKDMHIREDEKRNTVIVGAKECLVESADEVIQLLEGGNAARHTGTTQMNEFSSRSHAILTISVDQQVLNLEGANRTVWNTGETSATSVQLISSKFHFVDLAGSERVTKTGNTGERFKESVQINSGLLALGNVISALGDPRRKSQHVPYRDSKITRILKDSLGGNAKTLMIACISPSSFNFDESLNSLKYANRARSIRNKPIVNYNPDWDRINEMELEIQALRQALQNRRGALVNRANQASQSLTEEQEKIRIRSLEERLALLQFECCHYRNCTEDAFRILLELKGTASLPKNQLCKLQEWIDVTEGFQADNSTPRLNSTAEEEAHLITCLQLKRELKKCQDALAADEKAFSQKEAELKQLQARINTVLQENKVHLAFLDEEENKQKLQKEKMVEQQLLIDRLRQQLQGNNTILYKSCLSTDGTSDNDSRCVKRSYSVPHQSSQTESFTATKVTQRTSKKSDTSHVFCCLKHSNFDRNRRANLRASARSDPGVSDEITAEKRSTEETTNMTDDIFKSRHSMPKSSREMKYEFSALMDQMYYWRLEDQKIREQDKEDQKWQRERDKEESKRQREEVQEESRRQREEDQRKQEEDRERFTILLQVIQTSIQEGHKQQQQLLEEMKQHVKSIQEQQEKLCRGVQKEVDNSQNSAPKMEEGFSCDMRDIEERVRKKELEMLLASAR